MGKSLLLSFILSSAIFLVFSPIFYQVTFYLHPIALAVVFFCLFFLISFFILLFQKKSVKIPFPLFMCILIVYTGALLVLLFFRPSSTSYISLNFTPFNTIEFFLSGRVNWFISFYNLTANVGLFIPYGIYFRIRKSSFLNLLLYSTVTIISIEILQFATRRGSMDIDDLILNVSGVTLGYLFYPLFRKVFNIR